MVLVALLGFRVFFNYTKWIFPKMEGPTRRRGPGLHKAGLTIIMLTLLSLVIESLLRMAGFPLI